MKDRHVNCFNCMHFYVTWDPNFPRGCRAFQFKTAKIPSVQVFEASGKRCLRFKKKQLKTT